MNINHVDEKSKGQIYTTTDLGLATTLSFHFPIQAINRQNPNKVVFIFHETDKLQKFIEKYFRNELVIEPQTFINQIKNIKTRIYSGG